MSGSRTQLSLDVDGTLEFYPDARPDAAASLHVYNEALTPLDATLDPVAVPLDVVDEALTVEAFAGDPTITVASTVGLVIGRRYRLVNEEGRDREVRVIGFSAASGLIRFDQPLPFDCAVTTSRLRGHRLAYTIDAALLSIRRRRMRAHWVFEIGGVAFQKDVHFDVVLSPFNLVINEETVELADTSFGEAIGAKESWKKNRKQAINHVWRSLAKFQVKPDLVRDRDALRDACVFALLAYFHFKDEALRKAWFEAYNWAMSDFKASHAWYDSDDDQAVAFGHSTTILYGDEAVTGHAHNSLHGLSHGHAREDMGLPASYIPVG